MPIVIGFDAAWGGLGICLATANGPVLVEHHGLASRSWRVAALLDVLAQLEHRIADLAVCAHPQDPPPRVVFERAPFVYAGRGNQAATAWGLGHCAGALELWGCRPTWSYPWAVPPGTWRRWWWPKPPKGRRACKLAAIRQVQGSPWRRHLTGYDAGPDGEGPGGDVAEAILLAVGAARRLGSPLTIGEAPAGPAAWDKARRDGTAYEAAPVHPQLIDGSKYRPREGS